MSERLEAGRRRARRSLVALALLTVAVAAVRLGETAQPPPPTPSSAPAATGDAASPTQPMPDGALAARRSDPPRRAADWPSAANTGVPDGTVLSPAGAQTVVEDGAVVEDLDVRGTIEVRAHRVTIRRSRVRSRAHVLIRVYPGFVGTVIEDVELDGLGSTATDGITGSHVTVRRSNIHDVVDGIKIGHWSVYEDNWIHGLAAGDDAHPDGMQALEAAGFEIRGNVIDAPASRGGNAALLLKADSGPISDGVIEGNRLNGGNYTVFIIGAGDGSNARFGVQRVTFRGNAYGSDARYGVRLTSHVDALTWSDDERPSW